MEYDIPQEVQDIFLEYVGLTELRDRYVKVVPFGYKKAAKAAKEAAKKRHLFWRRVYAIYPEILNDPSTTYEITTGKINTLKDKA